MKDWRKAAHDGDPVRVLWSGCTAVLDENQPGAEAVSARREDSERTADAEDEPGRLALVGSPCPAEAEGAGATGETEADVASERREREELKTFGPRRISWSEADPADVTKEDDVDMLHEPAWPEIEVPEDAAVGDVFEIAQEEAVARLVLEGEAGESAKASGLIAALHGERSAGCARANT